MPVSGREKSWGSKNAKELVWKNNVSLCNNFLAAKYDVIIDWIAFWDDVKKYTLDFINNLNIKNESSLKLQARYDWILINKNNKLNISSIDNVEVFGDYPVTKEAILPSDHYGVLVDIT